MLGRRAKKESSDKTLFVKILSELVSKYKYFYREKPIYFSKYSLIVVLSRYMFIFIRKAQDLLKIKKKLIYNIDGSMFISNFV